ncbi:MULTISPECIES: GIY-YIG nuclease family protein [Actinosynnema]|uniref:GIY-YIG nuclease family protein n=1 Tax=Actinosynnema TaxID=40566 RepID=UPI0020A5A016|nr:GIY-YIG nuclease family protein [Actinosynnema pretiosum]
MPTIEHFARELRELRIDCGEPSFALISRLTSKDRESISVGSVHALLTGKRQTKPEIVRAFVRAVLRHRDGGTLPEHAEVVDHWFTLWRKIRLASQTESPKASTSPRAEEPSAPLTEPSPPGAPRTWPSTRSSQTSTHQRAQQNRFLPSRVRSFKALLNDALTQVDDQGRRWADAKHGCFVFYDYDGEPLYLGQTVESLRARVSRHLSHQRTDATASGILDVREVAEMELWPLWENESHPKSPESKTLARQRLDALESTLYQRLLAESRFGALLSTRIFDVVEPAEPPPSRRFSLVDEQTRQDWGHQSVRIARQASNLARLADHALESGAAGEHINRTMVVQGLRLTQLMASFYASAIGEFEPRTHIDGLDRWVRPRPEPDVSAQQEPL